MTKPLLPWLAFPKIHAESSGWRQGDAEHWWNTYWWPYWEQLDDEQQRRIINDTTTPKDWQEKLSYFMKPYVVDKKETQKRLQGKL